MRHFTNVKDLGDLNIALKEAFEVKANRFGYKELGKNKDIFQLQFTHTFEYSKSCNKFGYECDGARYQSGGMEARDRAGSGYGR